jgi:hypothetical protein
MRRVLLIVAALALVAPPPAPRVAAAPRLAGAAPSIDALVARFLRVLANGDWAKLERLRVSEGEYLDIILPGNVEPGEAPRRFPPAKREFFWSLLDGKSRYAEAALLAEHGGRPYRAREVHFRKGTKRYAGFTAHRRLALTVEDAEGSRHELHTGSVAEVSGGYKFVSFVRD